MKYVREQFWTRGTWNGKLQTRYITKQKNKQIRAFLDKRNMEQNRTEQEERGMKQN